MKNEALKIDSVFKNFYTKQLKEKCNDLKIYKNIEEIINIEKEIKTDTKRNKAVAEDIATIICITLFVIVFLLNCWLFNIFYFNFQDIMFLFLNAICSFFFISLLSFFIFLNLRSFIHSIININKKPKGMSFSVFYSFFHFGVMRHINKIANKIIINPNIFYELIQKTHYSENEKNNMIEKYSKEKLEKEISLASFSRIVARITIKYDYGHILSNFYRSFL